jgi:hypothetical protein
MKEEHIQKISGVFFDVMPRCIPFLMPCGLQDLAKSPGILDSVFKHMLALGRQITLDQLRAHRQSAGAWYNLCVPVQYIEIKAGFDRFVAKKSAGEYQEWPGLSGFGDDWALFLMNAWRGGYDPKNAASHAEFIGLTRVSPYLLGPIEGFARQEFGDPNRPIDSPPAKAPSQPVESEIRNSNGAAATEDQRRAETEQWDCTREMALRLIEIEKATPRSVRIAPNLMLTWAVADRLKSMGFTKPFLASKQQFIYDTILTHEKALEAVLSTCLLSGPLDSNGQHLCWFGSGRFAGTQGVFQLGDFTGEVTKNIPLIINVEPLMAKLTGLLEPSPATRR